MSKSLYMSPSFEDNLLAEQKKEWQAYLSLSKCKMNMVDTFENEYRRG